MKRMMATAMAMLVVAGFLSTESAEARTFTQAHFLTVQSTVPPVPIATVCDVNGVDYQVDYGNRVWAVNAYGYWLVIGRIVITPYGTTVAIRLDGRQFPAACQ
ncbi:MAG: hypothetical protein WBW84_18570 [Acidobacteriaceae bacterium]